MSTTYTQPSTTNGVRTYTTNAPVTNTGVTRVVQTNAPVTHTTGQVIRTSGPVSYTQAPVTYTNAPITTTGTRTYTTQAPVVTNTVRTTPVTTVRTGATNERRLDELSARILARKVFAKYDDNRSGYMNSQETGQMIADLYSSLNVDHPANREEGLEFMKANDANNDNSISLNDFEDIFVQHLSTGDQSGFRLFLDANTYATRHNLTGGIKAQHGPTTTYVRPSNVSNGVVRN